jgi:LuxR family transcriptional regulator, maltose regulon positive regulatory protein
MAQAKSEAADVHYYSDRLKDKLHQLLVSRTTIVEAPSGYGKTTAVRDYLAAFLPPSTPVYWFTAIDELPEVSYGRLAAVIAKIDENAGGLLLKAGLLNSTATGAACDALRSLKCLNETFLIVDNFQYLFNVMPAPLFTALTEHGGERLHIILLTQPLKKESLSARRDYYHLKMSDLRLDSADIRQLFTLSGLNISLTAAEKVEGFTGGWMIAVCLQLRSYRETGGFEDTGDIMRLMENLVWKNLNEKQQEFFLCLSPFAELTVPRMCALMGWADLPAYALDALSIPFIYYAPAELRYRPHQILLDFVVLKCQEKGERYENACLTRAGDLYRAEGDTAQALSFYWRLGTKEYERILSLDLSHLLPECNNVVPFAQAAFDIAQNCPDETMSHNLLSMLRIAWALLLSSNYAEFGVLMEKLAGMLEVCDEDDGDLLRGEWTLLSVYLSFPRLDEMTKTAEKAAGLLGGIVSSVIFPETPWCFGAITQLDEFHLEKGQADREADALEKYLSVYSKLTGGHGKGADALFRAELAICRGEWNNAEIFAYKAAFLAENSRQGIIQLGAARVLAEIAMFRGDADAWLEALHSTERALAHPVQNTPVIRTAFEIARGLLYAELCLPEPVVPWLQNGDFAGKPLLPPMISAALYVHLSCLALKGRNTLLAGKAEALPREVGDKSAFSRMLLSLLLAVGHHLAGNREQSAAHLHTAAELEMSEGFVTHFATWAVYLGERADETVKTEYPDQYQSYLAIKESLAAGRNVISRSLLQSEPEGLTEREREIASLAAQGLRNSEIAEKLCVTESTVRYHLRAAFQKLGIDRRAKLAEKLK